VKNYNYDSFGHCDVGAPEFHAVSKVGSEAPDFCLSDVDGSQVSLSSFRNKKHVLLEFGSITWPPFVGEVPPLIALYRGYRDQGFQFFIIYSREAHPGENYSHHRSFEQKKEYGKKLRELDKVTEIPILLDDIDGSTHLAYGSLPNMVYLINREGTVVYKSDWTDAHEIDGMCASLLRLDEMKAQGVPIIRQGVSERLHWIAMDPVQRESVYRRSGPKAIQDYFNAKGSLPYATDAQKRE
jgi:Iodothyronine deiodinase